MTGITHMLVGGELAWAVVSIGEKISGLPVPVEIKALIALAGGVAALVPDVDTLTTFGHANSKLGYASAIFLPGFLITLIGLLFSGKKGRRHRGYTHSLLAWGLFSIATIFQFVLIYHYYYPHYPHLYIYLGVASILGYLSHLIIDCLNPTGLPLLFPFSDRKYKIFKNFSIKTGSLGELLFALPFLIIFFAIGGNVLQNL